MKDFFQGDIIKIIGYSNEFLIVSNNAFVKAVKGFHICPVIKNLKEGPTHIKIEGIQGTKGTVVCEQIKFIDYTVRNCSRIDRITYGDIMTVSDVLQGIFEYD